MEGRRQKEFAILLNNLIFHAETGIKIVLSFG